MGGESSIWNLQLVAINLRVATLGCDTPGIEQDNLERIFERSFSTKQADHSGVGLHWCANTLIAANGRIYAESQGSGQGACLHVMIPNNV